PPERVKGNARPFSRDRGGESRAKKTSPAGGDARRAPTEGGSMKIQPINKREAQRLRGLCQMADPTILSGRIWEWQKESETSWSEPKPCSTPRWRRSSALKRTATSGALGRSQSLSVSSLKPLWIRIGLHSILDRCPAGH